MNKPVKIIVTALGVILIIVSVISLGIWIRFKKEIKQAKNLEINQPLTQLTEAFSALARIKEIDSTNKVIKAEVGLPRADRNQKIQTKEFALKILTTTEFKENLSLDQLKPNNLIFIETRENILKHWDQKYGALTLKSLKKIEINKATTK